MLAEQWLRPANPPEWIEMLSPQVVLLSVAAGDREGRPEVKTLEALERYTLLRTDRNGWLDLLRPGSAGLHGLPVLLQPGVIDSPDVLQERKIFWVYFQMRKWFYWL